MPWGVTAIKQPGNISEIIETERNAACNAHSVGPADNGDGHTQPDVTSSSHGDAENFAYLIIVVTITIIRCFNECSSITAVTITHSFTFADNMPGCILSAMLQQQPSSHRTVYIGMFWYNSYVSHLSVKKIHFRTMAFCSLLHTWIK